LFRFSIFVAALVVICHAACPFSKLANRADDPSDILLQRSRSIIAEFSELPSDRRLLSTVKLGANGKPTLTQATVTAIEADFCTLGGGVLGTIPSTTTTTTTGRGGRTATASTAGTCSVTKGTNRADANSIARADIIGGVLQLGAHDVATFDRFNKDGLGLGGADGCVCMKKGENKGLTFILNLLDPIYTTKYSNLISKADFWAVMGNAAIKMAIPEANAPLTVAFKYGRADSPDCSACSAAMEERLPNEELGLSHVIDVFGTRMGFTNKEIVALMGAHSVGRMDPHVTGHAGVWDDTMSLLDSAYYNTILNRPWVRFQVDETTVVANSLSNGAVSAPYPNDVHVATKMEWRIPGNTDTSAFSTQPKLFNTDMCLAWDIGDGSSVAAVNANKCTTRPGTTSPSVAQGRRAAAPVDGTCGPQPAAEMAAAVQLYATDTATFLKDFSAAWTKLMSMTTSTLVDVGTSQTALVGEDEWTEAVRPVF